MPRQIEFSVIRSAVAMRDVFRAFLAPVGLALGSIFFIPRPLIGLLLWMAFFPNPSYVVFALLGLAIGVSIKRLLRIRDAPILGGGLKANALLAAVVTGWLTGGLGLAWGPRLALASASAIAATLVAAAIMRMLSRSLFPPLLWGYCLVAAMLFSVCPQCTVISANAMQPWLPPNDAIAWVGSFLRSLGSLIYSPEIEAGVFVGLAILWWSRTMFISGLVAWISGVCVALAFQEMHLVYYWLPVSYNYFITGIALGSVIFLPGRLSLLVAALGGCAASFFALALQYAINWSAISYLPLSSGMAILVGIGVFTRDRSLEMKNVMADMPPEARWWRIAYWYERFGPNFPLLAVPVSGVLEVSQGFDGSLSHMGMFSHALDFQRPLASGSIWGASVTSPASGVVERIKNLIPDNELGKSNHAEKWGNYVVIRLDKGGWVLLAHLQQGTIAVVPGDRVEPGSYIGLVGNSGRSPLPHLHLHLQITPEPGSPTTPFRLANYLSGTHSEGALSSWNAAALPDVGDVVMAAPQNTAVYQTLVGMVPGSAVWVVESKGRIPREFQQPAGPLRIDVLLDDLGQHVFKSGSKGTLVSRLDPDAWRIVELKQVRSPFFKLLALAAPSIPYAAKTGMVWSDLVPTSPPGGLVGALTLSLAPYLKPSFPKVSCECISAPGIDGNVFEIDSRMEERSATLPFKVTCQFALLRGPVRIQADFHGGTLVYSLLSYEPRLRGEDGADG